MRVTGGTTFSASGKETDVRKRVPTVRGRRHDSRREVEFTRDHSACELEKLRSAFELLRAARAAHECVRIEEFHPIGGPAELEQHHASPVKLEQIHSVASVQCIEPHGSTPKPRRPFQIILAIPERLNRISGPVHDAISLSELVYSLLN